MSTPIFFPSTTPNYELPLLFAGQAQKEFSINQAFGLIDVALQRAVLGSQSTPSQDAAEGSCYRVISAAEGEWLGHEDALACRIGGAWQFIRPYKGLTVFDQSAGCWLHYETGWQAAPEPILPSGGANIDSEARAAIIGLIEALRSAGILSNSAQSTSP